MTVPTSDNPISNVSPVRFITANVLKNSWRGNRGRTL